MFFKNIDEISDSSESLEFDKDGKPSRRDFQLAVTVLLVAMAYRDRDFRIEELDEVRQGLQQKFQINEKECENLIRTALLLHKNDRGLNFFLQTITFHFSDNQKQTVLSMLWSVAEADGVVKDVEAELATDIRVRLGLSMEQALRARELAELEEH